MNRTAPTLLRLAAALLALAAAPLRADPATLYRGAVLIDGTGAAPRSGLDLLVDGERIAGIGAQGSLAVPAGTITVDLTGQFVIPGLIDSHVHLATPPNRRQAEAVLRRNLYGGVTAVRDMADDLRAVGELARAARAAEIPAPDIYYAALLAGPSFFADKRTAATSFGFKPGTAPWMQAIGDSTDIPAAITLARGTSAVAVKLYANLPPARVKALTREAHRQHLLVWAHSAVFPTRPSEVIAAGADTVSHVCYLAYQHAAVMPESYQARVPIDESVIGTPADRISAALFAQMRRRGTVLDATGVIAERFEAARRADPALPKWRCSSDLVARLTAQAWRAGVPVAAGTDIDASADSQWPALFEELDFLTRRVGMPPLEALRSATMVSAQAAGQGADMGTLAAGKLANFVVLQANPADAIAALKTAVLTVKRGRAYPRSAYRPVTAEELAP